MAIIVTKEVVYLPVLGKDGKFVHCSYCNQRFLFGYEASKHEKEKHADQFESTTL